MEKVEQRKSDMTDSHSATQADSIEDDYEDDFEVRKKEEVRKNLNKDICNHHYYFMSTVRITSQTFKNALTAILRLAKNQRAVETFPI